MAHTITDQSLADVRRRQWAEPLVPHLMTLSCARRCGGRMVFDGHSSTQGMGPTVNRHVCSECGVNEEIADDHYPRLEYRTTGEGRVVNLATGRREPR